MNMKIKHQKGMTLMELLVAGIISIIVTSGMVTLMASTLGTGTQTIKMTQLSSELRSAMQLMTRELRRANYHASFANCFGDQNCIATLGIAGEVTEININNTEDCFWFWYDRPQLLGVTPVDVTNETVAAFQRTVTDDGIGIIQMYVTRDGGQTITGCPTLEDANSIWADVTNPDLVDVTAFNVTNAVANFASYTLVNEGTQSVERIGITMTGRLREDDASLPGWMQSNIAPLLTVGDFVRVRNDIFRPGT